MKACLNNNRQCSGARLSFADRKVCPNSTSMQPSYVCRPGFSSKGTNDFESSVRADERFRYSGRPHHTTKKVVRVVRRAKDGTRVPRKKAYVGTVGFKSRDHRRATIVGNTSSSKRVKIQRNRVYRRNTHESALLRSQHCGPSTCVIQPFPAEGNKYSTSTRRTQRAEYDEWTSFPPGKRNPTLKTLRPICMPSISEDKERFVAQSSTDSCSDQNRNVKVDSMIEYILEVSLDETLEAAPPSVTHDHKLFETSCPNVSPIHESHDAADHINENTESVKRNVKKVLTTLESVITKIKMSRGRSIFKTKSVKRSDQDPAGTLSVPDDALISTEQLKEERQTQVTSTTLPEALLERSSGKVERYSTVESKQRIMDHEVLWLENRNIRQMVGDETRNIDQNTGVLDASGSSILKCSTRQESKELLETIRINDLDYSPCRMTDNNFALMEDQQTAEKCSSQAKRVESSARNSFAGRLPNCGGECVLSREKGFCSSKEFASLEDHMFPNTCHEGINQTTNMTGNQVCGSSEIVLFTNNDYNWDTTETGGLCREETVPLKNTSVVIGLILSETTCAVNTEGHVNCQHPFGTTNVTPFYDNCSGGNLRSNCNFKLEPCNQHLKSHYSEFPSTKLTISRPLPTADCVERLVSEAVSVDNMQDGCPQKNETIRETQTDNTLNILESIGAGKSQMVTSHKLIDEEGEVLGGWRTAAVEHYSVISPQVLVQSKFKLRQELIPEHIKLVKRGSTSRLSNPGIVDGNWRIPGTASKRSTEVRNGDASIQPPKNDGANAQYNEVKYFTGQRGNYQVGQYSHGYVRDSADFDECYTISPTNMELTRDCCVDVYPAVDRSSSLTEEVRELKGVRGDASRDDTPIGLEPLVIYFNSCFRDSDSDIVVGIIGTPDFVPDKYLNTFSDIQIDGRTREDSSMSFELLSTQRYPVEDVGGLPMDNVFVHNYVKNTHEPRQETSTVRLTLEVVGENVPGVDSKQYREDVHRSDSTSKQRSSVEYTKSKTIENKTAGHTENNRLKQTKHTQSTVPKYCKAKRHERKFKKLKHWWNSCVKKMYRKVPPYRSFIGNELMPDMRNHLLEQQKIPSHKLSERSDCGQGYMSSRRSSIHQKGDAKSQDVHLSCTTTRCAGVPTVVSQPEHGSKLQCRKVAKTLSGYMDSNKSDEEQTSTIASAAEYGECASSMICPQQTGTGLNKCHCPSETTEDSDYHELLQQQSTPFNPPCQSVHFVTVNETAIDLFGPTSYNQSSRYPVHILPIISCSVTSNNPDGINVQGIPSLTTQKAVDHDEDTTISSNEATLGAGVMFSSEFGEILLDGGNEPITNGPEFYGTVRDARNASQGWGVRCCEPQDIWMLDNPGASFNTDQRPTQLYDKVAKYEAPRHEHASLTQQELHPAMLKDCDAMRFLPDVSSFENVFEENLSEDRTASEQWKLASVIGIGLHFPTLIAQENKIGVATLPHRCEVSQRRTWESCRSSSSISIKESMAYDFEHLVEDQHIDHSIHVSETLECVKTHVLPSRLEATSNSTINKPYVSPDEEPIEITTVRRGIKNLTYMEKMTEDFSPAQEEQELFTIPLASPYLLRATYNETSVENLGQGLLTNIGYSPEGYKGLFIEQPMVKSSVCTGTFRELTQESHKGITNVRNTSVSPKRHCLATHGVEEGVHQRASQILTLLDEYSCLGQENLEARKPVTNRTVTHSTFVEPASENRSYSRSDTRFILNHNFYLEEEENVLKIPVLRTKPIEHCGDRYSAFSATVCGSQRVQDDDTVWGRNDMSETALDGDLRREVNREYDGDYNRGLVSELFVLEKTKGDSIVTVSSTNLVPGYRSADIFAQSISEDIDLLSTSEHVVSSPNQTLLHQRQQFCRINMSTESDETLRFPAKVSVSNGSACQKCVTSLGKQACASGRATFGIASMDKDASYFDSRNNNELDMCALQTLGHIESQHSQESTSSVNIVRVERSFLNHTCKPFPSDNVGDEHSFSQENFARCKSVLLEMTPFTIEEYDVPKITQTTMTNSDLIAEEEITATSPVKAFGGSNPINREICSNDAGAMFKTGNRSFKKI